MSRRLAMFFWKKQKDTRAYPRVDFFQSTYFIVENENQPVTSECWFYDISVGGIGFESEKDNLDKATVDVVYKIGSQYRKDRLSIQYTNRLISKWRYGCKFLSQDENRNKLISYYIEKRTNGK